MINLSSNVFQFLSCGFVVKFYTIRTLKDAVRSNYNVRVSNKGEHHRLNCDFWSFPLNDHKAKGHLLFVDVAWFDVMDLLTDANMIAVPQEWWRGINQDLSCNTSNHAARHCRCPSIYVSLHQLWYGDFFKVPFCLFSRIWAIFQTIKLLLAPLKLLNGISNSVVGSTSCPFLYSTAVNK